MKKFTEFGNVVYPPTIPLLTQYDLNNADNYLTVITCDDATILDKYSSLMFEFMLYLFEKIKITKKNVTYFRYIFERGVDTVTRVFSGMLEYTKNIDLSFYHGQKSFYFYVEFIAQISDVQNSFLQLSSRDAVMFVYKRTIFDVNKEMSKNPSSLEQNPLVLKTFSIICKDCAISFIKHVSLLNQTEQICAFVATMRRIVTDLKKTDLKKIGALPDLIDNDSPTYSHTHFLENLSAIVKKNRCKT